MDRDAIRLDDQLTLAGRDEADHVGDITADAFRADPFNAWLFGNFRSMAIAFRGLARHVYTRRGYCYRLGDEGAAMWLLPGASTDLPLSALPTVIRAGLTSSSGGFGRIRRAVAAMDAAHPTYPHAYLFTIGVRPRAQGKGLGRQLIAPVLAACDRAGIPAYLENSNPANHGFYTASGFEPQGPIVPQDGAPPLMAMVRQPRG